jgi:hypothetical protein
MREKMFGKGHSMQGHWEQQNFSGEGMDDKHY